MRNASVNTAASGTTRNSAQERQRDREQISHLTQRRLAPSAVDRRSRGRSRRSARWSRSRGHRFRLSTAVAAAPPLQQVDGQQQRRTKRPASPRRWRSPRRSRTAPASSTISSGAISVFIGMLPAMKTTEPYSPTARAKARAKPVSSAGRIVGKITRRKVCQRPAPRLAAASSTSGSRSSRTGCSVRTTNGRPMNVSATTTPSGVKATLIPSGASQRPIQPLGA